LIYLLLFVINNMILMFLLNFFYLIKLFINLMELKMYYFKKYNYFIDILNY